MAAPDTVKNGSQFLNAERPGGVSNLYVPARDCAPAGQAALSEAMAKPFAVRQKMAEGCLIIRRPMISSVVQNFCF